MKSAVRKACTAAAASFKQGRYWRRHYIKRVSRAIRLVRVRRGAFKRWRTNRPSDWSLQPIDQHFGFWMAVIDLEEAEEALARLTGWEELDGVRFGSLAPPDPTQMLKNIGITLWPRGVKTKKARA